MNMSFKRTGLARCDREALFPCVTLHQLKALELAGSKLDLDLFAYKQVTSAT